MYDKNHNIVISLQLIKINEKEKKEKKKKCVSCSPLSMQCLAQCLVNSELVWNNWWMEEQLSCSGNAVGLISFYRWFCPCVYNEIQTVENI